MNPKIKKNFALFVIFIVISGLFLIGSSGFGILSGLRAYVGGEGLWSKAQKEATYQLVQYVFTGDENRYHSFLDKLKVPLGDKIARLELEKSDPDDEIITRGFLDGGNHPEDISMMIFLYAYFKHMPYIRIAIHEWETGDRLIGDLLELGEHIHHKITADTLSGAEATQALAAIDALQKKLNKAQDSFSNNMSTVARLAANLLFAVMAIFTFIGSILCFMLFRQMTGFIADLSQKSVQLENRAEKEIALREKLQESENKYRLLADNAADVIWIMDMNLNITFTSPSVEKLTGFTVQESIEKSLSDKMTPSSIDKINQAFMEELELEVQGNADPSRSRSLELEQICRDGSTVWVEATMSFLRDSLGKATGVLGITRNITERKKAEQMIKEGEEKLARLKKMESLGLLAGGVAHDLNNVLSGILSYPELILMDLPEDSKLRTPIKTIQESGHRAAAIVQDLLTVARGVATVKEPLNLNTIVENYLISPEFKKLAHFHPSVHFKTDLDVELFNVTGSRVHIRKALMNLISNAAEAVQGEGSVIISTLNRYVDRPIKGFNDIDIGEYTVLSVSDNGPGISKDDLERIFEPFYTKKVMGRSGTGLGLAVVWNTVQDHRGFINVASSDKGTTFDLYFPITREKLSDEHLAESIDSYKGNGETILVIDDLKTQQKISCSILEALGYQTESVSSGEEAIDYLKKHSTDLILLDMIMDPGINGRETYKRILQINPAQKAIIVSGFAETDDVKETIKAGAGRYIKKPFTLEKIAIAVKEELNQP